MGFDFIVIAPLLPSHCSFSFVFGCGVSFLVSSSVFLSMIVQQFIVIPVLSQEGVSTHPSTPPFEPISKWRLLYDQLEEGEQPEHGFRWFILVLWVKDESVWQLHYSLTREVALKANGEGKPSNRQRVRYSTWSSTLWGKGKGPDSQAVMNGLTIWANTWNEKDWTIRTRRRMGMDGHTGVDSKCGDLCITL